MLFLWYRKKMKGLVLLAFPKQQNQNRFQIVRGSDKWLPNLEADIVIRTEIKASKSSSAKNQEKD